MIGYIYHIINKVNGKRYIGETVQYETRKKTHLRNLKNGEHHSIKLQKAWNKYGEDNFEFQVRQVEISSLDELNKLEQEEIKKYNSYYDGYNQTIGGDGIIRKPLSFETYSIIRAGNERFEGMIKKTATYYRMDKSVVSDIIKLKTYLDYSDQYEDLNEEEKNNYLNIYIKQFNIDINNPPIYKNKLKVDYQVLSYCLCLMDEYDDIGKTLEEILSYAKGTMSKLHRRMGYEQAWEIYETYSKEEKKKIANQLFIDWRINEKYLERQSKQGGSLKSYQLTQNDFNHIFWALEHNVSKKEIAERVGVKEGTVYDWNSGRSRNKEKNKYQSLSEEQKQSISWPY